MMFAMEWKKASEQVKHAFAEALPDDPLVQRRQMFGYPAMFVNGNMAGGVHEDNIVVRLPEAKRAEALSLDGASPFMPAGRAMKEYVVLPPSMLADGASLSRWLGEAFAYGLSMPVKEPKPRKAKAKKS
jgi:TfoX/Sxy family transcriptional regulator of competence genes